MPRQPLTATAASLAGAGPLPATGAGQLAIGLMSGTSLDGADAVLALFPPASPPLLLAHRHRPFAPSLYDALTALQTEGPNEMHRAALAGLALADHYAALVEELLVGAGVERDAIVAIGAHGQTVRHRPELGYTLQVNAPARLAEATGIDVIADFRTADVAAGGQGAPLVPAFHAEIFGSPGRARAVLNLGGMANLTALPGCIQAGEEARPVRGWDCGPGNVLLDGWAKSHGRGSFDASGQWAAGGTVRDDLLVRLSAEPWLAVRPPKSTGRELFNLGWLQARLAGLPPIDPIDVQATLAAFTARSVARSLAEEMPDVSDVVVCGGGARNLDLLERIGTALYAELGRRISVEVSSRFGIDPEHVEALAFAWLALRRLLGLSGSLPAVTGAKGARILGAHYRGAPWRSR